MGVTPEIGRNRKVCHGIPNFSPSLSLPKREKFEDDVFSRVMYKIVFEFFGISKYFYYVRVNC